MNDCKIVACEKLESDYLVSIQRPDKTVVRVLVPREDVESLPSQWVAKSKEPFGLNMVTEDHYY